MKRFFWLVLFFPLLLLSFSPLQAQQLSDNDRRLYRDAFAAAKSGNWDAAWQNALQARDPLPQKVLRWLDFTRAGTGGKFADIAAFVQANPDWPRQKLLRQRAEEASAGVPDAQLAAWFAEHSAVSAWGKLRKAELAMNAGRQEEGYTLIRDVWVNTDFSAYEEKTFLQRFGSVIRSADHVRRLDRVVWDDQGEAIKRILARVAPDYRLLADARVKLAHSAPGVEKLVAKVPGNLQNDPGLLYERLRWRRHKEAYEGALEILQNAPADLVRPAAWWNERQIIARRVLADNKAALAYKLVARHGLKEGQSYADAEFLAGWIALRFLNDPATAYDHFVRLHEGVKFPVSVARGAYWAGRAATQMNKQALAQTWFSKAAENTTTYYGQLASEQLSSPLVRPAEPKPRPDEIAAFNKQELVRVVRDLNEIGAKDLLKLFVDRVSEKSKTPAEHMLTASLATSLDRFDLAVSAAKRASYDGVTLLAAGYPLTEVPEGGPVERPLVLAMTRQESAFDREAVSKAGAMGMMQLMPGTASQVAREIQVPYSASRLLSDAHYNLTLGKAYLGGLLDSFSGSYVLSVAAYNAGPARVRQWVRDFGDPRTKGVDVVDWVENIPFGETRNYVQRVLENLQVYRLRLGDHKLAFSLPSDLKR